MSSEREQTPDSSPCLGALLRHLSSTPALSHFALRVLRRDEAMSPCAADDAVIDAAAATAGAPRPCLSLLCRRSDESCAADAAYEPRDEFPAVLGAGGRAFFLQPSARSGAIHLVEDRLPPDGAALERVVAQLLAHEGTHAVDALEHGLDLTRSGALACSEVRAARAGECADAASGGADWFGVRRRCVRDTARRSAELAFPGAGAAAVDTVLSRCIDTPPRCAALEPGGELAEALAGRTPFR